MHNCTTIRTSVQFLLFNSSIIWSQLSKHSSQGSQLGTSPVNPRLQRLHVLPPTPSLHSHSPVLQLQWPESDPLGSQ